MAIMQSDITDLVRKNRLEKDQIIGKNTELLQAVFEHISLAVCLVSGDGEIKTCNQRFLQLLGMSPRYFDDNSSVRSIIKLANANNLMKEKLSIKRAVNWARSLDALQEIRHRLEMSSGTIVDMKLMALPDHEFIVTFDDVTEETRAKAALVSANEELEDRVAGRTAALLTANKQLKERARRQAEFEAQLLDAKNTAEAANLSKTRFLAAASHDLLQPINAAKLYISTLLDVVRSQEARSLSEKIAASFASVESLLQSLLEISRLEGEGAKFNVTEFCLDDVLSQLAVEFAPQAEVKGLRFDIVGSQKWVFSDKTYLRRIISNLISNAIDYTNEGRVLVGCRTTGGRLRIEIWDTGIGIMKQHHEVIFEEFQVETVLPQTKAAQPELKIVETQFSTKDVIALVIENDEEVLNAMTLKLDAWDISVLTANSTPSALLAMKQMGLAPDIIIADYQLDGDDNGFIAIESLREKANKDIPAIMVTGNQNIELDLEHEAERLDVEILRKPVPLRKLRALIGWKTRNQDELITQAHGLQ